MYLQNGIGVYGLIEHLPLFQSMSVKIYTNFLLSSGSSNFKISYLKDKMRYGM